MTERDLNVKLLFTTGAALPNVRVLLFPTVEIADEAAALLPAANAWAAKNNLSLTIEWAQTKVTTDYVAVVTSDLKNPKPDSYDIYMVDVVWPGDYAPYFQPLDEYLNQSTLDAHNPDILSNDHVGGKYGNQVPYQIHRATNSKTHLCQFAVALPFYADYGLFFYRTDLLAKYNRTVPTTWDELEATAAVILRAERKAGNTNLAGIVGQLDAYEGLTCNVAEWIKGSGGGSIMDENGHMTLNNNNSVWILSKMRDWINNDPWIIPTGSLVYREQAALDKFTAGDAIFMRNWPFCIKSISDAPTFNSTSGRTFGFGQLPGRLPGQGAATLGGWHLAIANSTKDPANAAKVLSWLSSAEVQKLRAINHGLLPTIKSLYQDPAVCNVIKYCDIFGQLQVAPRPSSQSNGHYLDVSQQIYTTVHQFLAGQGVSDIYQVLKTLTVQAEQAAGTYVDPARGPPEYIAYTSDLGIGMVVLYIIALSLFGATILLLLYHRNLRLVKAASPYFCILMILGSMTNLSTIFVYTGYYTKATCILQPWMLTLSFAFTMMALLEKNWRIFRIFNNPYMKTLNFGWMHFVGRAAFVIFAEAIVLIIWTATDPPVPTRVYLTDYNYLTCRSSSNGFHWAMIGVLFAMNFLLVAAAITLAWFTRHVRSEYNEAHKITLVVWNTASLAFIAIVIIFIDFLGAKVLYAIRSLIILETNGFLLCAFFGPIIRDILKRTSLGPNRDSQKTSSQGSKDTSSISTSKAKSVNPMLNRSTKDAKGGKEDVVGTGSDSEHMPVKEQIIIHTGTLVGRTGRTKLALSFAPLHHYLILLEPTKHFISVLPKDVPKSTGISFRIETYEITPATEDVNGIFTFGIMFNGTHSYEFLTSSKQVVDAWTERFRSVRNVGASVSHVLATA
ncbi:hypothetical protein HK104_001920 [Borealophlyctis nickersoniae]|nr:hypothetical protein HK104_001920 [Borealophlyctis nickersoniae]